MSGKEELPECLPPDYFLAVYEEAWDRAFNGNKKNVYESTAGGNFHVKRNAFKGLMHDPRGVDDLASMDKLFRAVASAVRFEAQRRGDRAAWHDVVDEMVKQLREIRA